MKRHVAKIQIFVRERFLHGVDHSGHALGDQPLQTRCTRFNRNVTT